MYFALFVFFIIMFVIGCRSAGSFKNLKEFALGSKKFGTASLIMTVAATSIGGGNSIGLISEFYTKGPMFFMVFVSAYMVSYFVLNCFVLSKFDHRFKDMVSYNDIILYFYGPKVELISASFGSVSALLVITAQFVAMGKVVSVFTGYSFELSVIISSLLVVAYTSFGGIKAIVYTDIVQFILFIIVMPAVCFFCLSSAGGFESVMTNVSSISSSFVALSNIEYLLLFAVVSFPQLYAPNCQRYLMADSVKQRKRINNVYIFIFFFFASILMLIAFSAISILPEHQNSKEILYVLANDIFAILVCSYCVGSYNLHHHVYSRFYFACSGGYNGAQRDKGT